VGYETWLGATENEKDKDTNRESLDQMDYTLLMGDVGPKLFHLVYFICKYKEVKAGKSLCTRFDQGTTVVEVICRSSD
jgi:hypothetical protein